MKVTTITRTINMTVMKQIKCIGINIQFYINQDHEKFVLAIKWPTESQINYTQDNMGAQMAVKYNTRPHIYTTEIRLKFLL